MNSREKLKADDDDDDDEMTIEGEKKAKPPPRERERERKPSFSFFTLSLTVLHAPPRSLLALLFSYLGINITSNQQLHNGHSAFHVPHTSHQPKRTISLLLDETVNLFLLLSYLKFQ